MNSRKSGPTGNPLVSQVATRDDAAQVADALITTWRDIDSALAPIIGSKGVAALYKRSVHLASSAHPWLAALRESNPTSIDLAELKSVVAQQTGALATLGAHALLQTFYQLLGSLIGPPLTERLLRSVWANSQGGAPLPDRRDDHQSEN